jgi:hypothetical protein
MNSQLTFVGQSAFHAGLGSRVAEEKRRRNPTTILLRGLGTERTVIREDIESEGRSAGA